MPDRTHERLTKAEAAMFAKIVSLPQKGWTDDELAVSILYTNHRGETAVRQIVPQYLWFGETQWHPGEQWLLRAKDCDRDGAERDFALKDVREWKQEPRP